MKKLNGMAVAVAMLWVACGAAHAQPVYKWVDENGKTHYGSQPPPAKADAEPLKLQSTNGTSGGSGSTSSSGKGGSSAKGKQEYNPDGTKKIPKDVAEFGEALKDSLGKVDSQQAPMNCAAAVDNIRYQADLMLEVGQKNVRDGYMTQAAFDATAPKIREAKGKYSVSDCQSASGNKKSFYQCMSSSKNHVTGCDKQFKH